MNTLVRRFKSLIEKRLRIGCWDQRDLCFNPATWNHKPLGKPLTSLNFGLDCVTPLLLWVELNLWGSSRTRVNKLFLWSATALVNLGYCNWIPNALSRHVFLTSSKYEVRVSIQLSSWWRLSSWLVDGHPSCCVLTQLREGRRGRERERTNSGSHSYKDTTPIMEVTPHDFI